MSENFRAQYDRMQRWYARFRKLDQGRAHDMPSEDYIDEIYTFFQNCYHLKDWIKNDCTVPQAVRDEAEAHINGNCSLRLCADICNSIKHLSRTHHRSGECPEFGTKHFKLDLGGGPPTISMTYEIKTSSGTIDAYQLATDCVNSWDSFLKPLGLQ